MKLTKENGSWVEQTDLTNLFDINKNYLKMKEREPK